jgi:FHIPEP family
MVQAGAQRQLATEQLLQLRMNEITTDLHTRPLRLRTVAPVIAEKDPSSTDVPSGRAASVGRLDIDGVSLRWCDSLTVSTLPPDGAPHDAIALAQAEVWCADILMSLLAQHAAWCGPGEPRRPSEWPTVTMHVADMAALGSADGRPPEKLLPLFQQGIYYELGLPVPNFNVVEDASLAPGQFRVAVNGVRHPPQWGPDQGELLVNCSQQQLDILGITEPSRPVRNPATLAEQRLLRRTDNNEAVCEAAGYTTWDAWSYRVLALAAGVRRAAEELLTEAVTNFLLDKLSLDQPVLVELVREDKSLPISMLTRVMSALVGEGVSIRDLPLILSSLLTVRATTDAEIANNTIAFSTAFSGLLPYGRQLVREEFELDEWLYCARVDSSRALSHQYGRGAGSMVVFLLEPAWEEAFRAGLAPTQQDKFLEALSTAVDAHSGGLDQSTPTAILTTGAIRRNVWQALRFEFPRIPVIAYQELQPSVRITPLTRIGGANQV